jgi:hypothetical protein
VLILKEMEESSGIGETRDEVGVQDRWKDGEWRIGLGQGSRMFVRDDVRSKAEVEEGRGYTRGCGRRKGRNGALSAEPWSGDYRIHYYLSSEK